MSTAIIETDAIKKIRTAYERGDQHFISCLGTFLNMSPMEMDCHFNSESLAPVFKDKKILRLISAYEMLSVGACDGTEVLANATDTFNDIDPDFDKWGMNKPSNGTCAALIEIHELINDATFAQAFGSFGIDLDRLCFTQHQIKNICRKYRRRLSCDRYPAFFLFKIESQYFVAVVGTFNEISMSLKTSPLLGSPKWNSGRRQRIIVPKKRSN